MILEIILLLILLTIFIYTFFIPHTLINNELYLTTIMWIGIIAVVTISLFLKYDTIITIGMILIVLILARMAFLIIKE